MNIPEVNEKRIASFVKTLEDETSVDFSYNEYHYEIFESADTGYVVNVYADNEKDANGDYLERHIIDGGLCTGSARDAVEFIL